MILAQEINEKGLRIKSFCDSCKNIYWSNVKGAVKHIKIRPGSYEYIVSVCPDCINKYDLNIRFAVLNGELDELIENNEKGVNDIIIKVECKNCGWIGQAIVGKKGFPLERYRCPVCGQDLKRAKGSYNYNNECAVLKK